jgi:signal transduction histidine kinase
MSHELRTPRERRHRHVGGAAERLFGTLNAKQAEYVNDIYGSGQHLLSLINDILDLSEDRGRATWSSTSPRFDLRRPVDNCCTLIRERVPCGSAWLLRCALDDVAGHSGPRTSASSSRC